MIIMKNWFFGTSRKQQLFMGALGVVVLLILVTYVGSEIGKKPTPAPATPAPAAVATPTSEASQPYLARDYKDYSSDGQSSASLSPSWSLGLGIIWKLLIVLLVLYLVLWALRKYMLRGKARIGDGTSIKVLESTALAQHQRLYLVRAGDKLLLLGGTDHQISTLAEFAETSSILSELEPEHAQTPAPSFPDILKRIKAPRVPQIPAPVPQIPAPAQTDERRAQDMIATATASFREKIDRLRRLSLG